ncbi:hypothetical protein GEMRC1_003461 [Eukaryota sp. GEM-RC1]
MECIACADSFNLSDRIPLLICSEGHTTCSECSSKLTKCPLCRITCLKEKKVNFALQDLVEASLNGDLCPEIPPNQILLGEKIADGGFASVHVADWFDLPVAVKMVSLTEKEESSFKER